jgi:hypothetical protein
MEVYKRFYFNWFITIVWVCVITWITFAYIHKWGNSPLDTVGYIIFLIIFLGAFAGVYRLRITIDDKNIEVKFGVFVRKVIPFKTIKEINLIENKYKYSPSKSGLKDFRSYQWPTLDKKGVEIKLLNKTGIIIGTNKPAELFEELKRRIVK